MSEQEFNDFEVEVDFNEVPAMTGEFTLLPPGNYEFVVKHAEMKTSSKNNPMVTCTFEVVQQIGEGIENPTMLAGQKAWGNYSLLPQSLGRLKQLMVACGTNLGKFRASELLEAHFIGTVVHTQGDASVGADGQPRAAKTFSNVQNERPLETEAKAVEPPPVAKAAANAAAKTTAKPTNGAARKA